MKTYTVESRFALGAENILFTGVCVHFSSRTFFQAGAVKGLNYLPNAELSPDSY